MSLAQLDINREEDFSSILSMMLGDVPFLNGIEVRDRKKTLKNYKACFVGTYLVVFPNLIFVQPAKQLNG